MMATAKDSEFDKVMGLDLGADDYLAKPFGMMEMVSRVKAVLRRTSPRVDKSVVSIGEIKIDKSKHKVIVGDREITLTLKEYDLLLLLLENPGRVFTREQLLSNVWEADAFIEHPNLAIEQIRIVISTMAKLTKNNLEVAFKIIEEYSQEAFNKAIELEDVIDTYEDKLGSYIVKIMRNELSSEQNQVLSMFLHSITDYERISDHAKNIAESAKEINDKKIKFSDSANKEMQNLVGALREILEITTEAFVDDDIEKAHKIAPLEEVIDSLCDQYKLNHIDRVQTGECKYEHGFVFNDMLTDMERVGDHCSNIGIAIRVEHNEIHNQHSVASKMEIEKEHSFKEYYNGYMDRFQI